MSHTAARPEPPPSAAPWMRPITIAGIGVDREKHLRAGARVAHVVVVRVAGHLRHPRGVGAGAEHLAGAGEHDDAQRRILVRALRPRGELGDDVLVERVADVGPVQRDALDGPRRSTSGTDSSSVLDYIGALDHGTWQ